MTQVLITGCAGFIGFHTTKLFLDKGVNVVGVDSLNTYYDTTLKKNRLKLLKKYKKFNFLKGDLSNKNFSSKISKRKFNYIVHLAAQAGVRHSLKDPNSYTKNNVEAFINILEICRQKKIKHLLYASSSSVYGHNLKQKFSEKDPVDHPLQLYAATKRSNELMAHAYSNLFNLPTTGLRFFTVYGPWGRPDMSIFIFVKSILENKKINIFNYGKHERSFTYVSDISESFYNLLKKPPKLNLKLKKKKIIDCDKSYAPYKIFNIGNNQTVKLMELILKIEKKLNKKSKKNFLKIQPGDIYKTKSDINSLKSFLKMKKNLVKIDRGLDFFISWYKSYFKIN